MKVIAVSTDAELYSAKKRTYITSRIVTPIRQETDPSYQFRCEGSLGITHVCKSAVHSETVSMTEDGFMSHCISHRASPSNHYLR